MFNKLYDIISFMTDKNKSSKKEKVVEKTVDIEKLQQQYPVTIQVEQQEQKDPQELLEQLLNDNKLKIDFDVIDGTITTKQGIIKLEKPTLVIRAYYV